MQEVLYIEDVDQATALLKPQRIEMLKLMDHPCTCLELGKIFGETPQKINYHIKALQNAGLVEHSSRGTRNLYALAPYGLRDLQQWLVDMWDTSLNAFADYVREIDRDTRRNT